MRGFLPSALLGASLVLNSAPADAASFAEKIVDSSPPPHPWMKAIGDLDGDGKNDLVLAFRNGPLVWYENTGDMASWTRRPIASSIGAGGSTTGIAIADLDGNGSPDVVLANGIWFANPRPGASAEDGTWVRHDIDAATGHDVLLSDLDRDGDLDVVKRNQFEEGVTIRIFRHDGGDSWTERDLTAEEGEGLALADLDHDGDDDIVIGRAWYENDRNVVGGAWTKHPYTTAYTHPHNLVKVGDLSGDGRPDILLTPSEFATQTYRISWFEAPSNPRSASWTEHVLQDPQEAVVHAAALGDFDRNGRLDVALGEMVQGADPDRVWVLFQNGSGAFAPEELSSGGTHGWVAGDLDGNGRLDLFGANWNSTDDPQGGKPKIWINQTTGTPVDPPDPPDPPDPGAPDAACVRSIERIAATHCHKQLKCHAPGASETCRARADDQRSTALDSIREQEPACTSALDSGDAARAALEPALDALADQVLGGAASGDGAAGKLQARLLGGLGGACEKELGAHAKDAVQPDADRLAEKLARARSRFVAHGESALERATKKGVAFAGPAPSAQADALEAALADFVAAFDAAPAPP